MNLRYKTKGGASPQGRPRVYFCCHRNDFNKYFGKITDEILELQRNAAIWYREPGEPFRGGSDFYDDLALMQLFVVPVTSNFLFDDDPARTVEFAFAEEHHIPVLPLMQEPGLENDFNWICGDLQFLDSNAARNDPTALPYRDKLKSFLSSVLVDDKLAERIRQAFDAYIFLSYRKKDRAAAQKVMKKIHMIKACRDTAIWYDEFLTPGENFNDEIAEAMRKSRLFTMVVTPSLLEDPNYVQTTEYPAAMDLGMKVLPVMAEETDEEELAGLYQGIGQCYPLSDPVSIAMKLRDLMSGVVLGAKRDDPEHKFLMGLAYLSGVDVEINQNRAVSLIAEAAEDGGLAEAYEKIINMLRSGDAVERDYDEAIAWQEEYADVLQARAEEQQSAEAYQDYFVALAYLEQYQADQEEMDDAYDSAMRMKEAADKLGQLGHDRALWDLAAACERLGDICFDRRDIGSAEEWYSKSLEARERTAEEKGTDEAMSDLGFSYSRMGDVCAAGGNFGGALDWYDRELNIRLADSREGARKRLADTYHKIGDIYAVSGNPEEARNWYEKDLEISSAIYDETGTAEAAQDLAVCYGRLGLISAGQGYTHEARSWYEKDLELCRAVNREAETLSSLWNLAVVFEYLGDLSVAEGKPEEALNWYESCEFYFDDITDMSGTVESLRSHFGICIKLADICEQIGRDKWADEWYEKLRDLKAAIEYAMSEDDDDDDDEEEE